MKALLCFVLAIAISSCLNLQHQSIKSYRIISSPLDPEKAKQVVVQMQDGGIVFSGYCRSNKSSYQQNGKLFRIVDRWVMPLKYCSDPNFDYELQKLFNSVEIVIYTGKTAIFKDSKDN